MHPITKELREIADEICERAGYGAPYGPSSEKEELCAIADRIDAEHRRRMGDCRREVRREVIHYMRGVLTDLERGVRRVRKCDKVEVVRCKDCVHSRPAEQEAVYYCDLEAFGLMGETAYCSLGERREVDE
jgi:hypothetical protein